jgi:hypothetical protein
MASSRLVTTIACIPVVIGLAAAGWYLEDCGVGTPCGDLLTTDEVKQLTGVSVGSPTVKKYLHSCSAYYHDPFDQELVVVEISKDTSFDNFGSRLAGYRDGSTLIGRIDELPGFDADAFAIEVPAFQALLVHRPADGVRGSVEVHVYHGRAQTPFAKASLGQLVPLLRPRLKLADDWLRAQAPP